VPSAPADLKAVISTQNKILVTWLPPSEPNGIIVGYTLYTGLLEDGKEVSSKQQTTSKNSRSFI
jgi:hypothetical protein